MVSVVTVLVNAVLNVVLVRVLGLPRPRARHLDRRALQRRRSCSFSCATHCTASNDGRIARLVRADHRPLPVDGARRPLRLNHDAGRTLLPGDALVGADRARWRSRSALSLVVLAAAASAAPHPRVQRRRCAHGHARLGRRSPMKLRPFGLHPTVLVLASTHFLVDGFGNILAPLLPLLIPHLDLSLAAAGTLQMCFQLANSVVAARLRPHRRPLAAARAACWPVRCCRVTMLHADRPGARTSVTLGAVLVLGGLGGAAFHPPAAALVHRYSRTTSAAWRCRCTSPAARSARRWRRSCLRRSCSTSACRATPLLMIPALAALLLRPASRGSRRSSGCRSITTTGGFSRASTVREAADAALPDRRPAHADRHELLDVHACAC